MGTYQTPCPPGGRPGSGQVTAPPPPQVPPLDDQPIFLALDEAMWRPQRSQGPGRRKPRWPRRLACWVREKRLGLWLALLIGLGGLAYVLAFFTDVSRQYAPSYYEPKDVERWQWLQRGPR